MACQATAAVPYAIVTAATAWPATRDDHRKAIDDNDPKSAADPKYTRDRIRDDIGKFLFQKTERRPMILPVIIEV